MLVLKYLANTPVPPEEFRQRPDREPLGWEVRQLLEALPDHAAMVEQVVAVLARHALVRPGGGVNYPGNVGPSLYRIAPLGERCLFLLRDDEVQRAG